MDADTCALLAQILPVLLLTFAVRGSFMARASADEVRARPKRLARHRWLKDPRVEWGLVVIIFIVFEFLLALASARVLPMPAVLGWAGFGLALLFAAAELWIAGIASDK